MKKIFLLCLIILSNVIADAQALLVVQGNNEAITIEDASTKEFNHITMDAFGIFAGYEVIKDTLVCYFNKKGKLSHEKYFIGSKYNICKMPVKFRPDFDSCHWRTRVHSYKDYRLILGKGAILCQNGKLIWSVDNDYPSCTAIDSSRYYFLGGYISPQLSPDESSILFEVKRTAIWTASDWIVEIDFKTGEKTKIAKGIFPCYSPDGKFILYKDELYDIYYIYDKVKQKREELCSRCVPFWLYE